MKHVTAFCAAAAMVVAMVGLTPAPANGETLVGANVDSRVIMGFAAPQEAVQAWLPDGFTAITLPKGGMAGANLLLVLIDRHLDMAPDGAPAEPASSRSAVLASFGVAEGGGKPRLFATRIYATDADKDPYAVAVSAEVGRTSKLDGATAGERVRSEEWSVRPETGGSITVRYAHDAGVPVWSEGESRVFSAANPEYHRIYRYRQLDDLAMSEGLGKALSGEIEIRVDVPELATLFDGSERLVALITRPVYQRETFLP